jgi:hypothetical protein
MASAPGASLGTMNTQFNRIIGLLVAAALAMLPLIAARASEANPLTGYFNSTLLCKNQTSGVVCHLWLDADGRYFVYFDRGAQQVMPEAGGNFRLEGRHGHYRLSGRGLARELCLKPDAVPGKTFQVEKSGEPYAGTGCYRFELHQVGEHWSQNDAAGNSYQMWLVEGRG